MILPPKVAYPLLIGLFLLFVGGKTFDLITARQREGEWAMFDSATRAKPPQDPDGVRLSYPASWNQFFHSGGATKNGRELRMSFQSPYYLWSSKTYLNVWWRRVDASWTLQDALAWFEDDLGFGIRDSELETKHNTWSQTHVGVGRYPALVQTFADFNSPSQRRTVVLFIVGDEAFALTMHDDDIDEKTQQIFRRMLDSFEVYK